MMNLQKIFIGCQNIFIGVQKFGSVKHMKYIKIKYIFLFIKKLCVRKKKIKGPKSHSYNTKLLVRDKVMSSLKIH